MRAIMPFDTEKERKPLKIFELSFSWRSAAYLTVSLLVFMELIQYTYNGSLPFVLNFFIFMMDAFIFIPGTLFSFVKHPQSGLFLDRHLIYALRHKKKQSGMWRR
jgi:hypothetical protein